MDWSNIWILAEQNNGKIHPVSFELLARGRYLADKRGCSLHAIVLTDEIIDSELKELLFFGADNVFCIQDPLLSHFLVEPYSLALLYLLEIYHPEIIIAAATTTGRTIMPFLSVKAHAGLTADCTLLDIDPETQELLQTRPAIGGNIMATIRTPVNRPQMATVRPKSIAPLPRNPDHFCQVLHVNLPKDLLTSRVLFENFIPDETQDISIQEADVIVAGGRGMRTSENFSLLSDLAEALRGAVGASRMPIDLGWQPYPRQIGLSGKTVSPKLYIACGISGAIQHLAGIQTAETIIAINSDPNAPIFQVANFGIVGNLFDVIPALTEKIKLKHKRDNK
jgi:electron transfer flavoprotein alpha subunit